MKYHVRHRTIYRYSDPVSLCQNQVHLTPRASARQVCLSASLHVLPVPTVRERWLDYFGNEAIFFSIEESHAKLEVIAESQIEVAATPSVNLEQSPSWEVVRGLLAHGRDEDVLAATQFTFDSPYIQRSTDAADYARESFSPERPFLSAVMDLTTRLHRDFQFDPHATDVYTTPAEVLRSRRGVCQDFAHLQITCLRSWGLAARYVSGYLLTDPPPGQARMVGADASHAWISVYLPQVGWFDFDPTNDIMPGDRHIVVAWGRDYRDVRPIQGVFLGGGQHSMSVHVDVVPAS